MKITKHEPDLMASVAYQLHLDAEEHFKYCPAEGYCEGASELIYDLTARVLAVAMPMINSEFQDKVLEIEAKVNKVLHLAGLAQEQPKQQATPIEQWNQLYKNAPLPTEPPPEEAHAQTWPGGEDYPDFEDYHPGDYGPYI